jgi:Fe2+ or Zn2+ uptake regulation protein
MCKECGMTTQIEDNIDEAIKTWQRAFSKDYFEYYDVCTGCSSNFGKDE